MWIKIQRAGRVLDGTLIIAELVACRAALAIGFDKKGMFTQNGTAKKRLPAQKVA